MEIDVGLAAVKSTSMTKGRVVKVIKVIKVILTFSLTKTVMFLKIILKKSLLKRQAGTSISLKDRRAAPALGSRLLRSYVPLRCGPNASGSARDTDVPAHVRQSDFSISSYITKTDFTPRASLLAPRV